MKKKILKGIKKFFSSGLFIPVFVLIIVLSMNTLNKAEIFDEGEVRIVTLQVGALKHIRR